MTIFERIEDLQAKVKSIETDEKKREKNALPSDCYFLADDEIVCYPRRFGDSRYPYAKDGLTLWAHASGSIGIEESTFNVLVGFPEGKEPNLAFFFGEKRENGYFPVSLTGAGKQPVEENVRRYTVYAPEAAYYFTKTGDITACVRVFVDDDKNARFTVAVQNEGTTAAEGYLSAFFNCMVSHGYEYHETKWYRKAQVVENGFLVQMDECVDRLNMFVYYGRIYRDVANDGVYSTTSRTDFNGGMHNQLCCSTALRAGRFEKGVNVTRFSDTAIEGDILPVRIGGGERYCVSYTLAFGDDRNSVEEKAKKGSETAAIDGALYAPQSKDSFGQAIPKVSFEGLEIEGLEDERTAHFIKNVFRQNEFCARAKNYAGAYIGIRDIFQQLESALVWIPNYCRGKIIEALRNIGENGRAPRQYSYTTSSSALPAMDLRPYIDQGVWIISTVYTYLSYTSDFSILDEECGYYRFEGSRVAFSDQKDSVLGHLIRICDYLVSNIDKDTHCLHALYGDWNDALDGLGRTDEEGKEYGTGVSVMATLQLYQNLAEMTEILRRTGKEALAATYAKKREEIKEGLLRYAVVRNEKGERKVLHGWGDKRSWFVGSFGDVDGENRDSLTSNAFWVLSGALALDESQKADILAIYDRLDSKYGLKTFEPYFAASNKKVGRIVNLPKGTAENGAVYIHATLFGIWSLFRMGEGERGWKQLAKILPITHEHISTTPFVMPNSYCYNEEFGIDGESMSDWFTGSGCVLLKVLLWEIFGVKADLDGLRVQMPAFVPFKKGSVELCVKGGKITVSYEKRGGKRRYLVNGREAESVCLSNEALQGKEVVITVID